jgi:hypothetical protein
LTRFNFSINSAAFNVARGTLECTREFLEDVETHSFRLSRGYVWNPALRKVLYEDCERLLHYDLLAPRNEEPTAALLDEISREKLLLRRQSVAGKLHAARRRVREVLGPEAKAWIVRGYLRCSLLGTLEYWDDLDVVVEMDKNRVRSVVERGELRFEVNYHGNLKLFESDGSTMDIWSLREGWGIEDELSGYAHDVDAVAWNVESGVVVNPCGARVSAGSRTVDVMERYLRQASIEELAYTSFKTAYLCLRHGMRPGRRAQELMREEVGMDGFLSMNVARLVKELCCATEGGVAESIAWMRNDVGDLPILRIMQALLI